MEPEQLSKVLRTLNESAIQSDGEITIDSLIPLEDKIKKLRIVLQEMNSRILYLKAFNAENKMTELLENDLKTTYDKFTEEITSQCVINNKGIKLCLEAEALDKILNDQDNPTPQNEKIEQLCKSLYTRNDEVLRMQNEIKELQRKSIHLNAKNIQESKNYQDFLKEQEELRVNKLQQTNPTEASFKAKIESTIQKINLMKKLMMKLISNSNILLSDDESRALELLKKHRKLINMEYISDMLQEADKSTTD